MRQELWEEETGIMGRACRALGLRRAFVSILRAVGSHCRFLVSARPSGFGTENGWVMCVDKPPVTMACVQGRADRST